MNRNERRGMIITAFALFVSVLLVFGTTSREDFKPMKPAPVPSKPMFFAQHREIEG